MTVVMGVVVALLLWVALLLDRAVAHLSTIIDLLRTTSKKGNGDE